MQSHDLTTGSPAPLAGPIHCPADPLAVAAALGIRAIDRRAAMLALRVRAALEPQCRTVQVPYSEAAVYARVAGMTLEAVEEDRYVNGSLIPPAQRRGCCVVAPGGARVPLLKSEAGWSQS